MTVPRTDPQNLQTTPVSVTFRTDAIALEGDETFTLSFSPQDPNAFGLNPTLRNTITATIEDATSNEQCRIN